MCTTEYVIIMIFHRLLCDEWAIQCFVDRETTPIPMVSGGDAQKHTHHSAVSLSQMKGWVVINAIGCPSDHSY